MTTSKLAIYIPSYKPFKAPEIDYYRPIQVVEFLDESFIKS